MPSSAASCIFVPCRRVFNHQEMLSFDHQKPFKNTVKQRHQHFRFIPLSSVPTLVGHDLTAISASFGNKKLHHFETKSHTWSLLVWQTLLSAQGNVQISRSNSGTKQSTFASTLFSANKIRCARHAAGRSRKLLDVCWLTNSPPSLCESRGLSQLDANIVGS